MNALNKQFSFLHGCDTLIPHKYNTKLEPPKKTLFSQKRPVQELVSSGLSWYFWPWNNGLYSLAGLGFIVHIFFGESHRMTENTGEMVNEDCWKTADVEDCCKIIARLLEDMLSNPF